MYRAADTIKMLNIIAQYFILFKALIEFGENSLFCPIYPNNFNALYNPTKNAIDDAYPNKMNGSK